MTDQIRFFVPPDQWFELLEEIAERDSLEVVFRRFKTSNHEAGYHLASLGSLKERYSEGDYQLILLSAGTVPAHEQDWKFMDRAAEDLLESRGGNWEQNRLGLRTLRIVSKESRVKPVFDDFRQAVERMCRQGMRSQGTEFPDILYVPDSGWEYRSGPEEGSALYEPL